MMMMMMMIHADLQVIERKEDGFKWILLRTEG